MLFTAPQTAPAAELLDTFLAAVGLPQQADDAEQQR